MKNRQIRRRQSMNVYCIETETEFQSLVADWNRLARMTDPSSVFLRHEWFDAAWQWLKRDCQMVTLLVSNGQHLLGICPLMVRTIRCHGIRIRNLEFQDIPDTQNCNILAEPSERQEVISAVIDYLRSSVIKWDRLELRKLDSISDIVGVVKNNAERASLSVRCQEDSINPGISLEQTWDEFYSRRSRRLKKGNNHVANRLKKTGKNVSVTHLGADVLGRDDMSHVLDTITGLSSRSWKQTTGLTLDEPGPSAFIHRLTEHAHKQDWISLWLLNIDGVPVAMEYQLVYDGIISALRADYDPAFEDLSPGNYLNWKMLAQLFERGFRYYSMGPGENTYKFRWAEKLPSQLRLTLYNNTPRGRMLCALDGKLRPWLVALVGIVKGVTKGKS